MSALERTAVERVLATAAQLGITLPAEVKGLADRMVCGDWGGTATAGARAWCQAHPEYLTDDAPFVGCCDGEVNRGADGCYCWEPEYDVEQAAPVPDLDGITATGVMCQDCAYRPGSPERAEAFIAEALMALPADGAPFWCHQGMRRPVRWRHPDGRTVEGDPADYHPPTVGGVPYQADGRPGRLCSGWAAIRLANQVTRAAQASTASGTDA